MITNPAPVVVEIDEDKDELPYVNTKSGAALRTKQIRLIDPDLAVDRVMHEVSTRIINIDAKLRESDSRGNVTFKHYRNLKELRESKAFWRRVRDHYTLAQIREAGEAMLEKGPPKSIQIRESINSDAFNLGLYPDEITSNGKVFPIQDTFLPSPNSPYSKQQLWVDYQQMHAQCWEAATKNPIAKRIIRLVPQFVLGRGMVGATPDKKGQEAWDEFWEFNGMKLRGKQILKELLVYGEVFLRYFRAVNGNLALRSIDPSTIWDIITNVDDLEDVIYYHQQYVVSMSSPVPGLSSMAPSTLIIRQIPAAEIDHFKINSTSSEKRGRSELYAILGWLLRFKEFANDRVLLNKMRAMFALDVKVTGDKGDVATAETQFATPPGSGAVLIHNEAVEVEFKNANTNANDAQTDADMILKIIAVGAGVSEQFLGVARAQTRAGALISTEPDVKNFEDYQELMEEVHAKAWRRVKERKGIDKKVKMEFTFPAIAQEDRSAKLKDVVYTEAADYISKRRAATMAAKEFGISEYDFDKEQQEIKKEREGEPEPVMPTGMQQVPKVAPDPVEQAEELNAVYAEQEEDPGVTQTSAEMGFASGISGRGLPNTKATLNRPGFTRGNEKASIKGNKGTGSKSKGNSGTPVRASGETPSKRGWSTKARAAALEARKKRRDERLLNVSKLV